MAEGGPKRSRADGSPDRNGRSVKMSRGRHTFRQSDISRALKAAQDAGQEVSRFEIDQDGRIVVVIGKTSEEAGKPVRNPWDEIDGKKTGV